MFAPHGVRRAATVVHAHCPVYLSRGPCGFPSPAEDYVEGSLDLNDHLIRHPAATFFLRAEGESMRSAGIHPGDLLVVDRAIEPRDGSVVVAAVDGHLTVKRLQLREGSAWLAPDTDDPAHAAIPLSEATDCRVWGVVTAVIHKP